jgi:tellurium resistance protein TerD
VDTIYYGKKSGSGVFHRGDNTTGDGAGDDERIRIDLLKVPRNIEELFVTVNIYTGNYSFG